MRGLSLVAASGGHSSSRCVGLSLSWPLLLRSTGSRRTGSVVVAHGPSCSAACGIFPNQGSNPCPLHWQADSQPLRHQGSPRLYYSFSFPKTKICGLSDKLFCLSKFCFNCNLAWKHNIVGNLEVILNTPFYGLSFVCISVGGNGNLKKKIKVHKIVIFSYNYL